MSLCAETVSCGQPMDRLFNTELVLSIRSTIKEPLGRLSIISTSLPSTADTEPASGSPEKTDQSNSEPTLTPLTGEVMDGLLLLDLNPTVLPSE
jgi:hypothetical protein